MKKEMDETKWGDILADRIKDWWVALGGGRDIIAATRGRAEAERRAVRERALGGPPLPPTHPAHTHRPQDGARCDRAQPDVPAPRAQSGQLHARRGEAAASPGGGVRCGVEAAGEPAAAPS